jgi:hypothetical protein
MSVASKVEAAVAKLASAGNGIGPGISSWIDRNLELKIPKSG